jgi:hypothetical protein
VSVPAKPEVGALPIALLITSSIAVLSPVATAFFTAVVNLSRTAGLASASAVRAPAASARNALAARSVFTRFTFPLRGMDPVHARLSLAAFKGAKTSPALTPWPLVDLLFA